MLNTNIKDFKGLKINSGTNNAVFCSEYNNLNNIKINISGSNNNINIKKIRIDGALNINIIGDNNSVEINEDIFIKRALFLSIYPGGPQFKGNNCNIVIGKNCNFNGSNIGLDCGEENTSIIIGEDCLFAQNVKFTTTDNHIIYSKETGERINQGGDIIVGNHVWFCENSTILNNSKIGSNSVVATRALVTGKCFPDNVCIAGVPAKIIKEGVNWKF